MKTTRSRLAGLSLAASLALGLAVSAPALAQEADPTPATQQPQTRQEDNDVPWGLAGLLGLGGLAGLRQRPHTHDVQVPVDRTPDRRP